MIAALKPENLRITVVGSLVTATAAAVLLLGLELWVMFVGWISFLTRGLTARHGLLNYLGASAGGDRAQRPVPGVRGRRWQVARLSYFVS